MATQGSGAAALNGAKGFELLKVKARSILIQEVITLRTDRRQPTPVLRVGQEIAKLVAVECLDEEELQGR